MDQPALRRVLWAAAPAVAAFIVYASTLGAAFVYDDEMLIRTNRWVQDPSVLTQLAWKPLLASPQMGNTNYYRPLVVILYNLTWQAGGGRPLAFHLLNVLMHMLNATLLLQLIRKIPAATEATAVGAALLFAVHPQNTEVVAWPSCLPELGYTAFGLGALLCHVHAWSRPPGPARRLRLTGYVLFALAISCKETALAFIPLVALLEFWLRPNREETHRKRAFAATRAVVPYVAAVALFVAARTAVLGGLVPRAARGLHSAGDAVLNGPWLLLLYLKSIFVPSALLVEHVVPLVTSVADPKFIAGTTLVGAGIVAIARARRVRPDLAFAASAALLPLVPALYLPALGRDPFAERYAYLSVAACSWLIVGGAGALARSGRFAAPRWALPALLGAIVLAAGARTAARCADWRDDGTLGRASMRDEPKAPIGYLLAGNWNLREHRKDEALRIFNDGLSHVPESVELQQNAIGVGMELGRLTPDDAIAAYERLVPLAAGSASAQFNLGQALLQRGRLDSAEAAFTRALQLSPQSVASMNALAVVASQKGDVAASIGFCRRALAVDDHSTAAWQQLGVALLRSGDTPGAIAALERAVQIDPADKESLNRLGVAYARAGRLDDSQRAWEHALAIDPDFAGAKQNLDRLRQKTR
jgi:protein O-mannosyl-transferase